MTELEKLEYTKQYILKLANGIDPITDTELVQDTILNHVRLSRCFFYVAEVIGREIAREKRHSAVKKDTFFLSDEALKGVVLSDSATISDFVDYLNSLVNNEAMTKLNSTKITNWLLENGYLEAKTDGLGKTRRLPSENGIKIGITCVEREGQYGTYITNLYDKNAQNFILDSLSRILGY